MKHSFASAISKGIPQGFSLVELSIILVILGLLTGGILAGRSLVRAAELRAVGTEYQRYTTAAQAFRDKYFALPGDMSNATDVWGKDATYCNGSSGAAATPGTCNGNSDGVINNAAASSQTGESFQFWKQLQLAGLIEGSLSGIAGPNGGNLDSIIGTNVPASRAANAGWSTGNLANYAGSTVIYAYNYANLLYFGGQLINNPTAYPNVLKPEEAWNIDTKIDDGVPGSGKILVRSYNAWGASNCTTSSGNADYTGTYNLSYTGVFCALYFARAF